MTEERIRLEELSRLLVVNGMTDLAWSRRAWECTEGHVLRYYRRLRVGARCPKITNDVRCAGFVQHPPLSWFDAEDALWEVGRRLGWQICLISYNGGLSYRWEIEDTWQKTAGNKPDAAIGVLVKALANLRREASHE